MAGPLACPSTLSSVGHSHGERRQADPTLAHLPKAYLGLSRAKPEQARGPQRPYQEASLPTGGRGGLQPPG